MSREKFEFAFKFSFIYSLGQDYSLADGDEEPYNEATYHVGLEHILSQLIELRHK